MVYQRAASKVLDALGDPTRRAVFEALAIEPHPVGEIAAGLPVSRPAVSQHLRVLKEAGLVRDRRDGNRRVYSVDPSGLGALRDYLERYWDSALEAFEKAAAKEGDER
jgi:DNA-binding transcriptional ArsR family regulator